MNGPPPNSLWRTWTGPFTEELVRHPARFGLGQLPARLVPDATTTLVCGYCSTGCGLKAHLRDGQAVNLTADPDHPVNFGMACPKGWEALAPLDAADRALTPLVRRRRGDPLEPVAWERAVGEFVRRFRDIQARHGKHSIAYLSTGQICTEEMALLGSLFKFGMGGLHCDSNTRQCMATAHVAYKQSFGFDAPPFTYADFEESDLLVFVGANPCIAHPILWQRVLQNPRKPRIVVLDPRRTETAMNATLHLPIAPKSDLRLLYAVAAELIRHGAVNREFVDAHTSGFDDFAEFVRDFTPEQACTVARVPRADFDRFVDWLAAGKRVSFWWTMGVNQGHEATRTAQALINLALMTGNIGRPGTGANSITGQCNAMGSRLFSNVTSLPGGRDFARADHRTEVARILNLPVHAVPSQPSWSYDQILDGVERGDIRGLWVIATNGAHSWIDADRFQRLLDRLDFLVVQDLYPTTATAVRADLLLPAAGWGEKDGTFINSERRIGLVRKVRRAPGEALADFAIFQLIAEAWGCGPQFRDWSSPEAAFAILQRLSAGTPCDFTGIRGYNHLAAEGGIQWPFTAAPHEANPADRLSSHVSKPATPSPDRQRRLFADGCFHHPDGRARFLFEQPRDPAELPDDRYPFILLTGRGTSAQWHTNTRTEKSAVLRRLYPEGCYAELHPDDAERLRISAGSRVRVSSRRGSLEAVAFITPTVQRGQVFIPMHYPEVNRLTFAAFDPHSRQPSYKHTAVTIAPVGVRH